jgi:hypothetical protein
MAAFRWWALVVAAAAAAAATVAGGDMNADRTECADQLVGLAPCLQYVQGQARAPPPDCCGGLRQVLAKSPKCLCVLVKDKDDPNLGIKINATLALALPSACGATRANASHCARKPPLLTRSCMAEQLATEMQSWFVPWMATASNCKQLGSEPALRVFSLAELLHIPPGSKDAAIFSPGGDKGSSAAPGEPDCPPLLPTLLVASPSIIS